MTDSTINFLFTYKEVGGVPTLFYNLALELKNRSIRFRLISYTNSEIYRLFSSFGTDHISLESITEQEVSNKLKSNDIIIITSWIPELIFFKKANPRILFWNVFPYTLLNSNPIYRNLINHRRNKRLIHCMIENNSLIFMDNEPFLWLEKYSIRSLEHLIVPIPIIEKKSKSDEPRYKKDPQQIIITYIGRAVDWKLYPFLSIYRDLISLHYSQQYKLILVTDDKVKATEFIKNNCNEIPSNIEILENLSLNELENFLDQYSDINIGMGTSCLESAALQIPTLLIRASYSPILGERNYKWLYNTVNYNLGAFSKPSEDDCFISIKEFIQDLVQDREYYRLQSLKCHEYVIKNHSLQGIADSFINYSNGSSLNVTTAMKLVNTYSRAYKAQVNFRNIIKSIIKKS